MKKKVTRKLSAKQRKPQGEVVVVKKKAGEPVSQDFFRSLMDFQYGNRDVSDAAFEKIKDGKIK